VIEEPELLVLVVAFLLAAYALGWFCRGWRDQSEEREKDGDESETAEPR
jgi:hypothetical protein